MENLKKKKDIPLSDNELKKLKKIESFVVKSKELESMGELKRAIKSYKRAINGFQDMVDSKFEC